MKTYAFVSVDGARAALPLPKSPQELIITNEQAAIASIVNFSGFRSYYDSYIQNFKIRYD